MAPIPGPEGPAILGHSSVVWKAPFGNPFSLERVVPNGQIANYYPL